MHSKLPQMEGEVGAPRARMLARFIAVGTVSGQLRIQHANIDP